MSAKCNGYRFAVEWCALNDESGESDLEIISETISVCLIADLFNITVEKVAFDVLKYRKAHNVFNAC
jgi:hypothetical protein